MGRVLLAIFQVKAPVTKAAGNGFGVVDGAALLTNLLITVTFCAADGFHNEVWHACDSIAGWRYYNRTARGV